MIQQPSKMKAYVHIKTCTWIFVATIFVIVKKKNLETIMSINMWIDKYIMVYPYQEMVLSNKKEWTTDICSSLNETQNNCSEYKNANFKNAYFLFHLYKNI